MRKAHQAGDLQQDAEDFNSKATMGPLHQATHADSSHTALDIFGLQGEVPETVMMGQTAAISNLWEFEWFEWVMYHSATAQLPKS